MIEVLYDGLGCCKKISFIYMSSRDSIYFAMMRWSRLMARGQWFDGVASSVEMRISALRFKVRSQIKPG